MQPTTSFPFPAPPQASPHHPSALASPASKSAPLLSNQLPSTPSRPPRLPRCSLRLVFVLCTIVQVSVACVCVWYIGYASQLSTVSTLSGQLRNQTIAHMIDQVASELSGPILAVNEVDLNTQQRMLQTGWGTGGDPYAALDWSTDVSYYTAMANIIRHYPGVTATAMQTSSSVLMTAVMLFNNADANATPPQLGFINQDVQSGWEWVYWQSSYNQTLSRTALLNDFDILATTANWFDILPDGDLARGRAHPLVSLGYVDPSVNNWWVLCMQTALKAIASNNTATINVGWSIPLYVVNHNTASVTETLSICKPHINMAPNVTWLWEAARAANVSGSPRAPFLLKQAAAQQNRTDNGMQPFPVIDWISDVTFDPYALVVFMTARLPSFVLDHGAAFICTTDGWILASTLPGADLSVLVYMPELLFPNTTELVSYAANVTAAHPIAMQFVRSLYNNMQSAAWQANINSVSLSSGAGQYQLGWEQSEMIDGAESYVQYAVLGVPASSFSFVLVVYSRQSDYQGGLVHNAQLSGGLSAVVIVVSIIATLLLTQCVNRPILTLISAMKAVLGDNPWQKSPTGVTPVNKAAKTKSSQRASFAISANKAPAILLPATSTLAHFDKPATEESPDTRSPSSPLTDQVSPLPIALPSPSHFNHVNKSGDSTLLDQDFLRTSSCSTVPFVSPNASTITRTITGPTVNGNSSPLAAHSIGQWQPIEAQPPVYTKYVPPIMSASGSRKPSHDLQQADKAVSVTIYNPPPPPAAATATTVHYPMTVSTDEPSKVNQRHSRSQADDSSSYELDLLLQKWQRTMLAQGVRLPPEWETDLQEDAQRLRELRMGLREARKRYQGKRRKTRAHPDESGPAAAGGSDNDEDEDDQSVFTPNDGKLSALNKLATYFRSRMGRADGDSPTNLEHSMSHQSMSTNSNSSNHAAHPLGCHCTSCQLHRFTNRLFGCAGNFSEVVQLQLTFGAMLFRLRNSALKLEQANQSKRQFLRFVFHEVRVPLNALGLGVEQLYEIGTSEREKREAHVEHLQKQQEVLTKVDDELHSTPCSTQTLSKLMVQLDQLQFDCPLCATSSALSTPPQAARFNSTTSLSNSSSSSDATSLALLNIVQDQVATVTRILNDVLSFQRIEDGELKLEMSPFNVCVMVDNTLHSFQAEFRQKQLLVKTEYRHYGRDREHTMTGVTTGQLLQKEGVKDTDVRVDIVNGHEERKEGLAATGDLELQIITRVPTPSSPLSWYVSGDQYRLRQVLSNFVSNAVKFSQQGGSITILATLSPNLDPTSTSTGQHHHPTAHFLELAVRDSGIGISPAGLRSLFQPYSQIRPGALQEGKGSGLGLSICKKLVELHGGRVVVSSTPGEGSTFSLGVPVDVMREVEVKEMLRQQGGASRSRDMLEAKDEGEEDEEEEDEHESKQLEGMDEEALRDGLYKYQPGMPEEGETAAPAPSATVPPIQLPEESPTDVPEGAQRTTSDHAATSPAAFTPTTITELAVDTANIQPTNPSSQPDLQPPTLPTNAASQLNVSQSVRLPSRRLASALAKPSNTPPGLGTAVGGRRKLVSVGERGRVGSDAGEVLRALVVEDSAVNRKLLVMMIEKMGLAVESAEDGQYAYEMVANYIKEQQHTAALATPHTSPSPTPSPPSARTPPPPALCQYDVIFLDDHMPRCTGVECVALLRALGVGIPIFGITANALLEDQQRFVAAGVTAVVTKPMQKKQLVDMIATVRRIKDEHRKKVDRERVDKAGEQ